MNQIHNILNDEECNILHVILERSINNMKDLEIPKFRMEFFEHRKTLDDFERIQLIRKTRDETKYKLSLVGLHLTNSDLSQKTFNDIDCICDILRDHYKSNLETPIKIDDIKNTLSLDKSYLVFCLNVLCQGSSMGRTTDMMSEGAEITPNERLFDFKHYSEIPEQHLPSWFPNHFKEKTKTHGNTEVNASKREAVLGAALAALVNFPQQCKTKDGKIKGGLIAKVLDEKSLLLFAQFDGEPPFEQNTISRLINKHIDLLK